MPHNLCFQRTQYGESFCSNPSQFSDINLSPTALDLLTQLQKLMHVKDIQAGTGNGQKHKALDELQELGLVRVINSPEPATNASTQDPIAPKKELDFLDVRFDVLNAFIDIVEKHPSLDSWHGRLREANTIESLKSEVRMLNADTGTRIEGIAELLSFFE